MQLGSSEGTQDATRAEHGDDPAIKAAAAASWEDNKAAISAQVGWPADVGLVDYVNRARASR